MYSVRKYGGVLENRVYVESKALILGLACATGATDAIKGLSSDAFNHFVN